VSLLLCTVVASKWAHHEYGLHFGGPFFLWDIYIYIHTLLGQDRISCIPSWELQLYINKCAISIWAEVSGWLLIWVFAYHHNFSIYLALTPGLYSQHVVIFHVVASIGMCHEPVCIMYFSISECFLHLWLSFATTNSVWFLRFPSILKLFPTYAEHRSDWIIISVISVISFF
jgi:hypothetical protein